MYWDWGFWLIYLPVVGLSVTAGWYLRGVKAEDDARRIEAARLRHPSAIRDPWQKWEWDA